MKIVVCVKQVPDSTEVKINPETGALIRESVEAIINPFDEFALEEGLRIRDRFGGKVKVVTMGPPQAEKVLSDAIALGADDGYHISDPAFAGSDTWATSYTLAQAIKKIGTFDIIICGKQATDGDTAQVGPGVAEMLDIPFVAWVRKIEKISSSSLRVQRMMEYGYDIIEVPLPALISVVKEINIPRMVSLQGRLNAIHAEIKRMNVDDLDVDKKKLGLAGSPTQVLRTFAPERKAGGDKISGDVSVLVQKITSTIQNLDLLK